MGDHLCHLPRHGRRLHGGDRRHLYPGGRAIRQFQIAFGRAHADPAHADRHRDRPLAVRRAVHCDLDDRLHRARRHHCAQLYPARGFHPPRRRARKNLARGIAGSRFRPFQADSVDRACRHDRRGDDFARSDFPGPGDFAAVRACLVDLAHRAGDSGDLCRAARRRSSTPIGCAAEPPLLQPEPVAR